MLNAIFCIVYSFFVTLIQNLFGVLYKTFALVYIGSFLSGLYTGTSSFLVPLYIREFTPVELSSN